MKYDTSASYSNLNGLTDSTEEQLAEFVGEKKKDYYLKKWQKENSFNWAAFFLTLFWLGYRKMYMPIVIVLTIFLAIDILFVLLNVEGTIINRSLGFALSGGLGAGGNMLYKKHAQKQINEIEALSISDKEKMHELRKRGGTSKMGVLLALLLLVCYITLNIIVYSLA